MSGISLLSTGLNVKGGKCFLKRCKWSENNDFRGSKDLFLKYIEELKELVTKLWVGLVNGKKPKCELRPQYEAPYCPFFERKYASYA